VSRVPRCSLLVLACWLLAAAAAHGAAPGGDGRIAYQSFEELTDCGDQKACGSVSNVWTVKPSGRDARPLTTCDADTDTGCGTGPAWSPDGRRVAFAGKGGIWIMDADGSDAHSIGAPGTSPAWSPDGRRLAFLPYDGGIATVKVDGSGLRQLTTDIGDGAPAWSSAGAIAFARARSDFGADVMTMTANGTRLRRIARRCACYNPDYSPDGRWIAYERGTPKQVYATKRDGTATRRLTRSGGAEPAWSPTGRHIVYVRGGEIYIMRRDGTEPHRVRYPAKHDGDYGAPSWQPLRR
jgi:Tol biopolymer transport system component